MNKSHVVYTIGFTFLVSFFFILFLGTANAFLEQKIKDNDKEAYIRAVLDAFYVDQSGLSVEELFALFEEKVQTQYFQRESSGLYRELFLEDIAALYEEDPLRNLERVRELIQEDYNNFVTVYRLQDEGVQSVGIKFSGPGLWGTIRGILAFNDTITETRGLQIISMQETPGLGARIEEDWFREQFQGEKILNSTFLIRSGASRENKNDGVIDGVAGATVTSNSMQNIVQDSIGVLQSILGVRE